MEETIDTNVRTPNKNFKPDIFAVNVLPSLDSWFLLVMILEREEQGREIKGKARQSDRRGNENYESFWHFIEQLWTTRISRMPMDNVLLASFFGPKRLMFIIFTIIHFWEWKNLWMWMWKGYYNFYCISFELVHYFFGLVVTNYGWPKTEVRLFFSLLCPACTHTIFSQLLQPKNKNFCCRFIFVFPLDSSLY